MDVVWIVLAGVLGVAAGAGVGVGVYRAAVAKRDAAEAGERQRRIEQAEREAATAAEKLIVDAERDVLERKERAEREIEESRTEIRESERRLSKREDTLDRREQSLGDRERSLEDRLVKAAQREEAAQQKLGELDDQLAQQRRKLLEMSGMSEEQAVEELLRRVEDERRAEVGRVARKIEEEAGEHAKEKATEILLMTMQRIASEVTSESTVRAVEIPSDDLKGRIIGREGRNIRAIEKATGVDIIVDDTPGVIVVSCFDKVRQQVAVESLQKLIADGRMHPARIEEVVQKTRSEVEERVQKFGKDAVLELNLRKVHPSVSEAMGKLAYRTSYGQNVLKHSIEVAHMSQIIAEQLGLDGKLAKRAGFLHDIGKAMDHEMEGGHPKIGMEFARQFGEREPVLNVIGGHHGDIPATSFYTPIVMAADAVSSARPGARRESMERYVQRLNELQDIALSQPGVTEAYAIQAGREVRVMIDAASVGDDEAFLIAHNIARRVSDEMTFPGEIKVTVLRETRAIEIAR